MPARDDMLADILGTVRAATRALHPGVALPDAMRPATAAQTEHRAIIDGRTAAFSGDLEMRLALSAWLMSSVEMVRRTRIEGGARKLCLGGLADTAMDWLHAFDGYRSVTADPLEYKQLRQWVERELAEAEARR